MTIDKECALDNNREDQNEIDLYIGFCMSVFQTHLKIIIYSVLHFWYLSGGIFVCFYM